VVSTASSLIVTAGRLLVLGEEHRQRGPVLVGVLDLARRGAAARQQPHRVAVLARAQLDTYMGHAHGTILTRKPLPVRSTISRASIKVLMLCAGLTVSMTQAMTWSE
jgi:hypothetical protein